MYGVGVRIKMDVGHFLIGDFGEESVPHRHDYELEWRFEMGRLDANGFSVDIAWMKELLGVVAESLSGRLLNELPFFEERQSSVENFARYVLERLRELAGSITDDPFKRAKSSKVVVWEAPDAWASFSTGDGST